MSWARAARNGRLWPSVPSCPAAGHLECGPVAHDPGGRGRGSTGDLGPCRPGPNAGGITSRQRYRKSCSGEREPGGKPTGNRHRATAEGTEPENAGRRQTRGRTPDEGNQETADEGDEPGGQTGNRRKAHRDPGGREVRAPNHPVRVRGFGAALIYDAASAVLAQWAGHGHHHVLRQRDDQCRGDRRPAPGRYGRQARGEQVADRLQQRESR
jgi:hypothetical protein